MCQLRDHLNESIKWGITRTRRHRRQHGQNDQDQHQNDTSGAKRCGYGDQSVNKANGTQPLGKDTGGNQQHDHASECISHTAIGCFQPVEYIFSVKATAKFQNRGQQHTENENRDDVQLRSPFPVENKYTNNRRKRQDGVEGWGCGGNFVHIKHFVNHVLFFIQIALPEKVGDCHADNGHNRDGERSFKSKVNQRHFGGFGGQNDIARSRGENNRRRGGANRCGSTAADANIDHYREQRRHEQYAETCC